MDGTSELSWERLLSRTARAEPLERAARLSRDAFPEDTVDLGSQQPSADLLPREALRECFEHVLRSEDARCLGYVPDAGLPALRAAIARNLSEDGIPAEADDVVVTSGSQQALDLLARVLVDPGDAFLVEEATYPGTLHLLGAAGARLVGVPCDDEGPRLDDLRRLAGERPKGLYLMPNHHNPTGTCVSAPRRAEIVRWSHDAGVPLVEDDYDAELRLDGGAAPVRLRAMDPEVCHVGTFSKKLVPALRIGYLLCPPAVRDRVVPLKTATDNGTSGLLQRVLAEFLDRGHLRAHVARAVREYRARRDALETALRAELPPELGWRQPDHGLFLWIPLPEGTSPEAVYEEARSRGVRVMPSALSRVQGAASRGIRLTYCRESAARLVEGARRFAAAVRAVTGRRDPR